MGDSSDSEEFYDAEEITPAKGSKRSSICKNINVSDISIEEKEKIRNKTNDTQTNNTDVATSTPALENTVAQDKKKSMKNVVQGRKRFQELRLCVQTEEEDEPEPGAPVSAPMEHPFKIISHDTMSLQSMTSLGRIGRILSGVTDSYQNIREPTFAPSASSREPSTISDDPSSVDRNQTVELYLFVKDKLHGSQTLSTTDGDNLSVSESHRPLDALMVEPLSNASNQTMALPSPASTIESLTREFQDSLELSQSKYGEYLVRAQDEERTRGAAPDDAERGAGGGAGGVGGGRTHSEGRSPATGTSSLESATRRSEGGRARRRSAGDPPQGAALGAPLSDIEILEQVTVLNLDTGERVPLSVAEHKLPQCINPLSLHIMRLTSEYIGRTNDDEHTRETDEESESVCAGGAEDETKETKKEGMDRQTTAIKRKTEKLMRADLVKCHSQDNINIRLKRFFGSTVKKTVDAAKSLAQEVSHARHKEDVADIADDVRGETNIKLKASNSHKGPYDFDGCVRYVQELCAGEGPAHGAHAGAVWCCKFSVCGRLLATAGQDRLLRVWVTRDAHRMFQVGSDAPLAHTHTHTQTQELCAGEGPAHGAHAGAVWCCKFSVCGRLLATAGQDRLLRVWVTRDAHRMFQVGSDAPLAHTHTHTQTQELCAGEGPAHGAHAGAVWCCKFSVCGRLLATAGQDRLLRVWVTRDAHRMFQVGSGAPLAHTHTHTQTQELCAGEGPAHGAHAGAVWCCKFSVCGRLLATAGQDRLLRVWVTRDAHRMFQVGSGAPLAHTHTHTQTQELCAGEGPAHGAHAGAVWCCKFSVCGRLLATAGQDRLLRVWVTRDAHRMFQVGSGAPLAHTHTHTQTQELCAGEGPAHGAHAGAVWCCKFSVCGRLLATAGQDRLLRVWVTRDAHRMFQVGSGAPLAHTHTHTQTQELCAGEGPAHGAHAGAVWCCKFSVCGRLLATAGQDRLLRVWVTRDAHRMFQVGSGAPLAHTHTHTQTQELCAGEGPAHGAHAGAVWCCKFSVCGRLLATAGQDRLLRVWVTRDAHRMFQVGSGAPLAHTHTHTQTQELCAGEGPAHGAHAGAVWCCKFSVCGRLLATAGQDRLLRVWVTRDAHRMFQDMRTKYNAKQKASPTPSQESLASLAPPPPSPEDHPLGPSAPFCPKPFCIYSGHTSDLLDISWSKNNFILSSSMDKTVRLWHISRAECLCCFQHIDFVTAIVFHPRDDRYFLSGSLDGKLRLWDIPDKKVAVWNEVDGKTKLITAANFCQNGKFAVVGTYDGRCIFYTTDQLKYHTQIDVRSTRGKNSTGRKISGIEPMPNDDKILVTSNDSRIRLYDLRDLNLSCKYKGYVNVSSQIKASFSHDGKYIVSGSENQCIYIWKTYHDYSKFTSVRRDRNDFWEGIKAHNAVVTCAVFAPNPDHMIRMISERELRAAGRLTDADVEDMDELKAPEGGMVSSSQTGHVLVSTDFNGCIKVFVHKAKPKHSSLPASALA
ncbi:unnamed protein product [Euphydryas editha]|uniref:WD repeat-containing protein 44 n=1 Tax=Euphydryas editha TaxID=104508 RepID=A0AAU9TDJ1_EUPED|nr:unnamed protein product [Euphydryas editha]